MDLSLWQPLIEDRAFVPWLIKHPSDQVHIPNALLCAHLFYFLAPLLSLLALFKHMVLAISVWWVCMSMD